MNEHYLYLLLDIGVIVFPFLLSFDKKVKYSSKWYAIFPAILWIGIPFLLHDYWFTQMGVWGFNERYLTGPHLGNLPIEEILFFLVVPYSCTFIYACVRAYFPRATFKWFNWGVYAFIAIYSVGILVWGLGNWYSTLVALVSIPILLYLFRNRAAYTHVPIAFVLSVIPFFMMNSILTGLFTPEPIVWYNNAENIGFRWGTIPAEDILYSFILVVGNVLVYKSYVTRRARRLNVAA